MINKEYLKKLGFSLNENAMHEYTDGRFRVFAHTTIYENEKTYRFVIYDSNYSLALAICVILTNEEEKLENVCKCLGLTFEKQKGE